MATITTSKRIPDYHSDKKVDSIFDRVRADPRFNQRRSVDWFKSKIKDLGGFGPTIKTELIAETKHLQTNFPLPGAMHFFGYDAKHKDTLPYWDKYPLVIITSLNDDGFTGLNWHYAPYKMRAMLFDKVWAIASQYKNNRQQVMRLNWKLFSNFSKFPEAQFIVKRYLYSQIRTRLIKVPVEDWKTAIFLPVETFVGKSQGAVAADTVRKIANAR